MSEAAPRPVQDINLQASIWLERAHSGTWNADDQSALEEWLSQSHLNRAAYWRLEAAWSDASRLAALGQARFQDVAEVRKFATVALKIAASVALIVGLGIAGVNYLLKPSTETYRTSLGGRELVRFADGTEIELNTDTVLRTRMTTGERTVWLDRGEAFFRVKHNAKNPFTVLIGERRVTDLGTEFVVQRNAAQTQVAVVKGSVRFDTPDVQALVKAAMLMPGDVATASAASMLIAKETSDEMAAQMAWRRGLLVFRHTALGDAVNEFNRYNAIKLTISDPSAAQMPIGGIFRTDNLEDFTRSVKAVLGLNVKREGMDIVISR